VIKEKMKKQTIITLTAIVAVIMAAIFAGCVEKEAPVSTPTSITMPPPTSTPTPMPTLTPSPALCNDDDAFLEFSLDLGIGELVNEIFEALNEENYPKAEKLAADLETLTGKYMVEIEEYHVSQELSPIKIKMKESFFEYNLASKIIKNGTRNQEPSEILEAEKPLKKGMDILMDVIDDLITLEKSKLAELNREPKTWHRVTSFSGSDDKTTRPFTIKGDEWQIKYSVKTESGKTEYSTFGAYVYPRGETMSYVSSWDCNEKSCIDTQYIYKGNGDYYIKVISCFNNWKLEVEDYY
jgi:hypothetical protein